MFKIKSLAVLALLFVSALASFASNPDRVSSPDWTIHTSFDNSPRRIIDTPDAVYFLVHPYLYDKADYNKYYSNPAGGIFFIDKKNPDAGMQDFAKSVFLNGFDIRQLEIDPVTGIMAISFIDGGINIVTPDRKVVYISDIRDMTYKNSHIINAMSFDPVSHDLWVACGAGFIKIDHNTLKPAIVAKWNKPVADILPVGDKVFAIISNQICEADADKELAHPDSFKPVAGATYSIPARLMSLSPNHVAYLTNTGYVQLLSFDGAKWSRKQLLADSRILQNANKSVTDRIEHTFTQTAKGYYISADNKAYQINRNDDPSKAPTLVTTALPSGSTIYSSSYDLSTFWFFRQRGQFYSRTLSDNKWSDPSDPVRPDAPLSTYDMNFVYSPEYGLVATNRNYGVKCGNTVANIQPLVAAYKNGSWRNLSYVYNTPYKALESETAAAQFNTLCNVSHMKEPNGNVTVDPLHPNILHFGSIWLGHTALYLDDPKTAPLLHVNVTTNMNQEMNAKKVFPESSWDKHYAGATILGADADNNIWLCRNNIYPLDNTSANLLCLWAWTPEARNDAILNNDITKAGEWKKIEVDTDLFPEFFNTGLALRHPKNKNKIVTSCQGRDAVGRPLRIYDHNGTIEDTSDDKYYVIHHFRRNDGMLGNNNIANFLLEDPVSGDLIVLNGNTYIIDLSKPIENNTIDAKVLSVTSENDNSIIPSSAFEAYVACFDEYGRLWIGSAKDGVFGFNAERTKIIAHYTPDNSPLPSNTIYGIGWNPDTKSLFISTDKAIAEVRVDAASMRDASYEANAPFLSPKVVSPEFAGNVAIYNIPAGTSIRIRDARGNTVRTIADIYDGTAHWDLLDEEGNRVPTGKYTVSDASPASAFKDMTLPVTR